MKLKNGGIMERFIVWGTGSFGQDVVMRLISRFPIDFCVDSKIEINDKGNFYGLDVYHPDKILRNKELIGKVKIIVAIEACQGPIKLLLENGFRFYDDFLPIQNFINPTIDTGFFDYIKDGQERRTLIRKLAGGRKTCLVFGECHGRIYKKLFSMCKEFTENYALIDIPHVNSATKWMQGRLLHPEIYEECDILIYNKVFCDANKMLKLLPENCKKISVTNARFHGYTPQILEQKGRAPWNPEIKLRNYVTWRDQFVDKMIEEGKSEDEIIDLVSSDSYMDSTQVEQWIEHCLDELEQVEKDSDIRICDYLRENCRKRWLYFNWTMPSNEVLEVIARRILEKLDIHQTCDVNSKDINYQLNDLECPVYPCVSSALGAEFRNTLPECYISISPYDLRNVTVSGGFTFEEAIRYYIYVCRGELEKIWSKK